MKKVIRYDSGAVRGPVRMPNGWLKADAYLTRCGIFTYAKADGTQYRELRPQEEVFRSDSLDSLRQVPLTLGHPKEGNGLLTAENAKQYTVGNVGYGYPDGDVYVSGPVLITDAAAVSAVEGGTQELSCGYTADMDETPGEWMGMPYDAVQRNIEYNHVAILEKGRAGSAVRIKLDGQDAVQIETPKPGSPGSPLSGVAPKEHTVKIKLDEQEHDIADAAALAIERERAKTQARLDAATDAAKKAQTDAATAQAKLDAATAQIKELSDPKALSAKVAARAALEVDARRYLGNDVKLDELSDQAVKLEVLKTLRPETKLDGKDPVYVTAYYDATIEAEKKKSPALDAARKVVETKPTPSPRNDAAEPTDEDEARKKMVEENRNAWQRKS